MKGALFIGLAGVIWCGTASLAWADARGYCEAFAREEANEHVSGAAILDGRAVQQATGEQWDMWNRQALDDCLSLYAEVPETRTAAPKAAAKSKSKFTPGSEAWKDYCDRKYSSFDRATGTYISLSGKRRPCVAPKK